MKQRSLNDWLTYLEQLHPSSIDMGLGRLQQVAAKLNLSRPAPLVITVAGTNGKGSTCAFITALLAAQGLAVGVYNSPHLLHYVERITIKGQYVTADMLCDAFARIDKARDGISLTYFEFGTLAAFILFEQAKLDVVVLEVGLGGRLDAVNLIDSDIAVITSIGIDHQELLGSTRESIAFEKAGIFRQNKPAVCGDVQPPVTLIEQAKAKNVSLLVRGKDFNFTTDFHHWQWQGQDSQGQPIELVNLPLLTLPMQNAALALQTFALLGFPLEQENIAKTLAQVKVAGRLESHQINWHGKTINLLLDVGHNPHAADYLANFLRERSIIGKRYAVFSLLKDKDLLGVITPLLSHITDWAVAPLDSPRSNTIDALVDGFRLKDTQVVACTSIAEALTFQCGKATMDDEILVFGSFHVVAEALHWLELVT